MIFVTVGTHCQPFDRLVFLMDFLAPSLNHEVIAQTGAGLYKPVKMKAFDFAPRETMLAHFRDASLIIAHAGIGVIIDAKRAGTPLILFPRLQKHGEHNNDHQLEIAEQLSLEKRAGVRVVLREEGMANAIAELLKEQNQKRPGDFSGRDGLVRELQLFLDRI